MWLVNCINLNKYYKTHNEKLSYKSRPDVVIINFENYFKLEEKLTSLCSAIYRYKRKPYVVAYMDTWNSDNHKTAMNNGIDFTFSKQQVEYSSDCVSKFLEIIYPALINV